MTQRTILLEERLNILTSNPQAFKGNTRSRTNYIEKIKEYKPSGLTLFQKETGVGLLLSDASLDSNFNAKTARLKIQQSKNHIYWLSNLAGVTFEEYTPSFTPIHPVGKNRPNMIEYDTLKCPDFYNFFRKLFYPGYPNDTQKSPTSQIIDYITPLSLAIWFCGDGSRADWTKNEGKGISFHSQAFSFDTNNFLANVITNKLNLKASVKLDDPIKNQFRIDLSGESFDYFIETVGPYIDPNFFDRVPTPRIEGSRFGYMTSKELKKFLGTIYTDRVAFKKLIETYPNF